MSDQEHASVDYKDSLEQINSLLKANVPYIWVLTHEESRFLRDIYPIITQERKKKLWTWSSYSGLVEYDPMENPARATGDMDGTWDPRKALEKIASAVEPSVDKKPSPGSVWVLKDFNTVLQQGIPRQMRDMYSSMNRTRKTIIIVSPSLTHGPSCSKAGIEPTLEKQVVVVQYELPSRSQIETRLRGSIETIKFVKDEKSKLEEKSQTKVDYTPEEINKCSTALQGLTEEEVDRAFSTSITHLKKLDERRLLREKKQIIQRSEILEYIGQMPSMDEVGGLDEAKKFFLTYANQFTKEAEDYGVEPLKGILLTGIPGAGKSLIAKAIAATWNLPLLRLDVGKVMHGLVGGSEEKMRQVVTTCETVAPVVLWIDEIEKSLSGTKSSNFSDGGTLARVFGTLLTAMEERMKGVVIIATANDISALPPELIRRFNETMFVDLPVPEERAEIFEIHLKKRKRDPKKLKLNVERLVKLSDQFTGAEIEKAVKEAIARAFQTNSKDVTQPLLEGAIKDTKCIAKVMKEQIDALREWARTKARYASSLAAAANAPGKQTVTTSSGKVVDMGKDLDDLNEVATKKPGEKVKDHGSLGDLVE